MRFNQKGDISTLNGGSMKLVGKFTYLESSLSSTENDINMRLAKAGVSTDMLSITCKLNYLIAQSAGTVEYTDCTSAEG